MSNWSSRKKENHMNTYLSIITTVLVITQIIRLLQNTISLNRQNRLIKAQLDEIGEITDDDLDRKLKIDKMLFTLLPLILDKYAVEDDNEDEQ